MNELKSHRSVGLKQESVKIALYDGELDSHVASKTVIYAFFNNGIKNVHVMKPHTKNNLC